MDSNQLPYVRQNNDEDLFIQNPTMCQLRDNWKKELDSDAQVKS